MKNLAFLALGLTTLTLTLACGKAYDPNPGKPNRGGSLSDWAVDPNNYDYFFYSENLQPKPGAELTYRYVANDTLIPVQAPDNDNDKVAMAHMVMALQKDNTYRIFYREYLSCAKTLETQAPSTLPSETLAVTKTQNPGQIQGPAATPNQPGTPVHPAGSAQPGRSTQPGTSTQPGAPAQPNSALADNRHILIQAGVVSGTWKIENRRLVMEAPAAGDSTKFVRLANASKRASSSHDVIIGFNFENEMHAKGGLKGKSGDFKLVMSKFKFADYSDHDSQGNKWKPHTIAEADALLKDTCAPVTTTTAAPDNDPLAPSWTDINPVRDSTRPDLSLSEISTQD